MENNTNDKDLDIRTLGYYIDRALCVMVKRLNKELKSHDIPFQHSGYTIMKVLSLKDGVTQSELAHLLGKEKSGISRSLSSLDKEGFIARTALNGCTNEVFLTEKGKKIMPLLNSIATEISNQAFSGFSEKKRQDTMRNLTQIYKNSL